MKPRFFVLVASTLLISAIGCADHITFTQTSERRGDELYKSGQYAEAAGAYRNAARQNPKDYQAYYMMGQCFEQIGQHQQAMSAYRTSLQVQPLSVEGKHDHEQRVRTITGLAQAIAKSDTRDTETNAAVAQARLSQNPNDYLLLAKIYQFRGDADSAIEAYDHAVLLGPENFAAAKEYGLFLEKMGQPTKAEIALRRAYAINPKDQETAVALRRLGVVPGPSLKKESDLATPGMPKGPLPEVDLSKMKIGGSKQPAPAPAPSPTAEAPRD